MISTEKHNPFAELSRVTGYGLTLLSCALLSGCFSADLEELQAYADETLAKKGSAVEPLPPIKAYVRYLYQGEIAGLRDPFDPFFFGNTEMDAADSIDKSTQNKYINEVLTPIIEKNSSTTSSTACGGLELFKIRGKCGE